MKLLTILCLMGASGFAYAQAVYKTVDEEGRVSYTSSAPQNMGKVEVLEAPPEPTEEEMAVAKKQQAEYREDRLKREQQRSEKAVAEAQNPKPSQTTQRITTVIDRQIVPVPMIRRSPILRPRSSYPVTLPAPAPPRPGIPR